MSSLDIRVDVYSRRGSMFLAKVSLESIGMYISGFKVIESKEQPGSYYCRPPSVKTHKGWKDIIEFKKLDSPLWAEIENKAIEAKDLFLRHQEESGPVDPAAKLADEYTEEKFNRELDRAVDGLS